jgi:hypothetical protein
MADGATRTLATYAGLSFKLVLAWTVWLLRHYNCGLVVLDMVWLKFRPNHGGFSFKLLGHLNINMPEWVNLK